jgi:hypothetical protein
LEAENLTAEQPPHQSNRVVTLTNIRIRVLQKEKLVSV